MISSISFFTFLVESIPWVFTFSSYQCSMWPLLHWCKILQFTFTGKCKRFAKIQGAVTTLTFFSICQLQIHLFIFLLPSCLITAVCTWCLHCGSASASSDSNPPQLQGKLPMQEIQINRANSLFWVRVCFFFLDGCMFFNITWLIYVSLSRRLLLCLFVYWSGMSTAEMLLNSLWENRKGRGKERAAAILGQEPHMTERDLSLAQ